MDWDDIAANDEKLKGKTLNKKKLARVGIVVPPVKEQKRIVAILDEAFAGIDKAVANTERNLASARELFKSILNRTLETVAVAEPIQTLSDITNLIVDCEHKTAPTQEFGFPSIRTPNIKRGYIDFNNVKRVSEKTYLQWTRRAKPEPGDLILAREAPAGNIGVIPDGEKVCLGQRTVLIRPDKHIVDSHYLSYLILHPRIQRRLLDKSTGATVQHVNMRDIRSLGIGALSDLEQQRSNVNQLNDVQKEIDRLEERYMEKLAALTTLKRALLQKAFSGDLTAGKPLQPKLEAAIA